MRILIQPPHETADVSVASDEVRRALDALRTARINTDGGGTIESEGVVTGVVTIRSDEDAAKALEVLAQAGINASIG